MPSMSKDFLRCERCVFWERGEYGQGRCHRYPPKPMYQVALDGSGGSYGDNLWPYTAPDDWCGEHHAK